MPLRTAKLLEDIRDAAQFLIDDTARETWESYLRDRRLRQSVERGFEVIGEAMRRLSWEDPAAAERITAYRKAIGFRNTLIHGYDVVDHPTVWLSVKESLPVLRAEVERLLREAEGEGRTPGA